MLEVKEKDKTRITPIKMSCIRRTAKNNWIDHESNEEIFE
jgi:hypothetical protein